MDSQSLRLPQDAQHSPSEPPISGGTLQGVKWDFWGGVIDMFRGNTKTILWIVWWDITNQQHDMWVHWLVVSTLTPIRELICRGSAATWVAQHFSWGSNVNWWPEIAQIPQVLRVNKNCSHIVSYVHICCLDIWNHSQRGWTTTLY